MTIEYSVLDTGYVRLIESWGSEEGIIEAARMSTHGTFRGWEADAKFLRSLYLHKHMTPFEMAGLTIEVQAPIMVFREWHRHRTQSYNEASARYSPLPDENYVPSMNRICVETKGNRQAQSVSGNTPTYAAAIHFQERLIAHYHAAQDLYEEALAADIPKELARLCLPVGRYTRMRATANLRNWLQFLSLRLAPDAQYEIRQYAQTVDWIIAQKFPRTHSAFHEVGPEALQHTQV